MRHAPKGQPTFSPTVHCQLQALQTVHAAKIPCPVSPFMVFFWRFIGFLKICQPQVLQVAWQCIKFHVQLRVL